ncbi:MAG TPA: hypothetical protein VL243_03665 [Vicinamibacterales bacterium]|nr:hypothetical protein [Vicinamibacterales bacterium]
MLRRRRVLFFFTSALATYVVFFVTPPRPVIKALANTFPVALMTASDSDGGLRFVAKRSLEAYVQSALASYLADRNAVGQEPEQIVLGRIMAAVRETVLSQTQVPHPARTWSTLASGLGWCDQINAAVAHVAAHAFRKAQIYALYDPTRRTSPHTIGRVWSDERGDWLYFDAFFDVSLIFTRKEDGTLNFIATDQRAIPSRGKAPREIYRLHGWVMNEYRPSYGGQIGVKLVNHFGLGGIEAPPRENVAEKAPKPPAAYDQSIFERVARAYTAARMEALLDNSPSRAAYLAIATDAATTRDARAAELAAAARVFATSQ